jgi:SAM-dependent methyltransferase
MEPHDSEIQDVKLHYDNLLGDQYDWMIGDLREAAESQAELLSNLVESNAAPGKLALDLGCGTGLHTLALAELGFESVVCVDLSAKMLAILEANTRGLVGVTPIHADLRQGLGTAVENGTISAAVCMGDSLTHLPNTAAVAHLFDNVRKVLAPDGWFAISYRDLSDPLEGVGRFLPVRSDESTILTCFLEDAGSHVRVHDVFHRRNEAGTWDQFVGSYEKLKLAPTELVRLLGDAGFSDPVVERGPRGMWVIVARPRSA